MKVRLIARFKNEDFAEAVLRAGFKTLKSLAEVTGIGATTLSVYGNFRGYPKEGSKDAALLEATLNTPLEEMFDEDYQRCVHEKRGRTVTIVEKMRNLPEYAMPLLLNQSNIEPEIGEDSLRIEKLRENINEALKYLMEREAHILKMRFGLEDGVEHSLEETALHFKVTRERIRQIEAKALRKLKHPSLGHKLKLFFIG